MALPHTQNKVQWFPENPASTLGGMLAESERLKPSRTGPQALEWECLGSAAATIPERVKMWIGGVSERDA